MPTLLFIEDENTLAKNVQIYLQRYGWDVETCGSAEEGLARAAVLHPDVVALDFQLPGMNGLAAIAGIRDRDPHARIVMITGQGNVQLAVDAMKAGAADFLSKPVALAELRRVLDKLVNEGRMRNALDYYKVRDACGLDQMLGQSQPMRELKERIRRVLAADTVTSDVAPPAILITGETGTGKELVARACHYESRRAGAPFVEVNCAAIPANLLEAELFGYERGAFTDAKERKIGLIEAADGGTLFLDEIGEADGATQTKLLKVLEDQRIRRLGAVQERRVDVRIIAATNQSLEARVREGRFRADLLYRLRVIQIEVPPLRARDGDVLLLAGEFLQQFCRRYNKPNLSFNAAARRALANHAWPGNVRELRNVIEQSVLLAACDTIDAADLALATAGGTQEYTKPTDADGSEDSSELAQAERRLLLQALERTNWNVTRSARMLGISRDTLRYRIDKHGLCRPADGSDAGTAIPE